MDACNEFAGTFKRIMDGPAKHRASATRCPLVGLSPAAYSGWGTGRGVVEASQLGFYGRRVTTQDPFTDVIPLDGFPVAPR